MLVNIFCFDCSHPSGCEVVSHCGFELHFPSDWNSEHLFMRLLAIFISPLEKCLLKSFDHLDYLSFYCWVVKIYIYSRYKSLIQYMICNYFSHSVGCLFTLLTVTFATQKFFILMRFNLFFLLLLGLFVSYLKNDCLIQGHKGKDRGKDLPLWFLLRIL